MFFVELKTTFGISVNMGAALKVMPPVILCLPITSGVDVGGMVVTLPIFHYIFFLCDRWLQRDSDKLVFDMEAHMEQVCRTEFLREGKKGTHWHLSPLLEHF